MPLPRTVAELVLRVPVSLRFLAHYLLTRCHDTGYGSFMTTTNTITGTRYIAKCKRCGTVRSYLGEQPDRYGMDRETRCASCNKPQRAKAVAGTYSPAKVCNEKCTAAASHKCSCSCGGENHGADFGGLR